MVVGEKKKKKKKKRRRKEEEEEEGNKKRERKRLDPTAAAPQNHRSDSEANTQTEDRHGNHGKRRETAEIETHATPPCI